MGLCNSDLANRVAKYCMYIQYFGAKQDNDEAGVEKFYLQVPFVLYITSFIHRTEVRS